MNERVFTVICCIISFILSLLGSLIMLKIKESKSLHREKYFNFYYPFYTLWDSIHQGRAFNFSDLTKEEQERIVNFLIEHSLYANNELSDKIYILKCSRHKDFNASDKSFIKEADNAYNNIVDIMIRKESKLRHKYISKK